jgi:Ca2+-binding RTX toxin-like protein
MVSAPAPPVRISALAPPVMLSAPVSGLEAGQYHLYIIDTTGNISTESTNALTLKEGNILSSATISNLVGGTGADTITGGASADILTGGAGILTCF